MFLGAPMKSRMTVAELAERWNMPIAQVAKVAADSGLAVYPPDVDLPTAAMSSLPDSSLLKVTEQGQVLKRVSRAGTFGSGIAWVKLADCYVRVLQMQSVEAALKAAGVKWNLAPQKPKDSKFAELVRVVCEVDAKHEVALRWPQLFSHAEVAPLCKRLRISNPEALRKRVQSALKKTGDSLRPRPSGRGDSKTA